MLANTLRCGFQDNACRGRGRDRFAARDDCRAARVARRTSHAGIAATTMAAMAPLEDSAKQTAVTLTAGILATIAARLAAANLAGLVARLLARTARRATAILPKGLCLVASEQEGRHGENAHQDKLPHGEVPPKKSASKRLPATKPQSIHGWFGTLCPKA